MSRGDAVQPGSNGDFIVDARLGRRRPRTLAAGAESPRSAPPNNASLAMSVDSSPMIGMSPTRSHSAIGHNDESERADGGIGGGSR